MLKLKQTQTWGNQFPQIFGNLQLWCRSEESGASPLPAEIILLFLRLPSSGARGVPLIPVGKHKIFFDFVPSKKVTPHFRRGRDGVREYWIQLRLVGHGFRNKNEILPKYYHEQNISYFIFSGTFSKVPGISETGPTLSKYQEQAPNRSAANRPAPINGAVRFSPKKTGADDPGPTLLDLVVKQDNLDNQSQYVTGLDPRLRPIGATVESSSTKGDRW